MAVPVSIGFFFHTMFNVVDTYFASTISSVAVALIVNAEGANNTEIKKNHFVFCLRVDDI